MDKSKKYASETEEAITRDISEFDKDTANIYESIMVIAKRANQISSELKEELHSKLGDFSSPTDNLEEIFENTEQIEMSKFYERIPKPTLIATQEFLTGKIYYRNPKKETQTEVKQQESE